MSKQTDEVLARLDKCSQLLAECNTAKEAKHIADVMEAARVYAQRSGMGHKVVMLAEEYRERAILRLGELRPPEAMAKGTRGQLAGRGVIGTASPEAPINVPTNKELGLSDHISAHATRLATLGLQLFEQVVAKWKQAKDGTGLKTSLERAVREKIKGEKMAQPLPEGKFRVIYADPPWQYSDSRDGFENYGPAERHYPTMSIEELQAMPISEVAHDDCVLFLWVTSPMLGDSFTVIHAWGFDYKTLFVWDKVRHNFGHYNSVRHEFLMVTTRGSALPENKTLYDSVVVEERPSRHSEKPEIFRQIIETLYPTGPWLELFARKESDGWTIHGNEPVAR
jgi:N6-adenosine-specific RNA methylase IME4